MLLILTTVSEHLKLRFEGARYERMSGRVEGFFGPVPQLKLFESTFLFLKLKALKCSKPDVQLHKGPVTRRATQSLVFQKSEYRFCFSTHSLQQLMPSKPRCELS